MIYSAAFLLAEAVRRRLAPHCEPDHCVIAGSVRRRRPECGDIEVVCIPKTVRLTDLFGGGQPARDRSWMEACCSLGHLLKGDPFRGKYVQMRLPEDINLDLFMASPENWGFILAIRTGSAEFSHQVLARGWSGRGYHGDGGMLTRHGAQVAVREERDLFELAGVPWVEPEDRG